MRRVAADVRLIAGQVGDRRDRLRAEHSGRLQAEQFVRQNAAERSAADHQHVDRPAFGFVDRVVDPTARLILGEGGHCERHCNVTGRGHVRLPWAVRLQFGQAESATRRPCAL